MIIPRESQLVRIYVQLPPADAALLKKSFHPDGVLSVVQNILRPYRFHTSQIHWSTIYTVRIISVLTKSNC
jgi:hypothetical protein